MTGTTRQTRPTAAPMPPSIRKPPASGKACVFTAFTRKNTTAMQGKPMIRLQANLRSSARLGCQLISLKGLIMRMGGLKLNVKGRHCRPIAWVIFPRAGARVENEACIPTHFSGEKEPVFALGQITPSVGPFEARVFVGGGQE